MARNASAPAGLPLGTTHRRRLQQPVLEGIGDPALGLGLQHVGARVPQQAHDAFAIPHQALTFGAAVPGRAARFLIEAIFSKARLVSSG